MQLDSEETLVLPVTEKHGETDAVTDRRHNRLLSCSRSADTDLRKKTFERFCPRGESPSGLKGRERANISSKESVGIRRVIFGILPYVKIARLNRDAYGDERLFRHTEVDGQPSKKSEKSGGKDQLLYRGSLYNWIVCLILSEKVFCGNLRNWDRITPSNSPKALGTTFKKFGNERVHREVLCKSVNLKSAFRPKFEDRTQGETLRQGRCAHREAWDFTESVYQLKNQYKATLYSPTEKKVMPAPCSRKPEERQFVIDSGASLHMLSKKDFSSGELETL